MEFLILRYVLKISLINPKRRVLPYGSGEVESESKWKSKSKLESESEAVKGTEKGQLDSTNSDRST